MSEDRILFYVESNYGRLVQIMVRDRRAVVRDTMMYGEYVTFSNIHDQFIVEIKARVNDRQKKT